MTILGVLLATVVLRPARAEELPTEVGACSETTIEDIGYRLGDPDSGSAISYANGGVQVSYDTIPEIHRSRVGDSGKALPRQHPRGLSARRRSRQGL